MARYASPPYLWSVIAVVHHPEYIASSPSTGSYRWNKNALVRDLLRQRDDLEWFEPDAMPRAWVEAVHDPDYVAEVAEVRVPATKERRVGFQVSEGVSRRSFRVPGGTYLAAKMACQRGFAANLAGGSHHALADTGAGYCVFNDLAIAANRLAAEGRRVLVVDCDVHQGDGTAALLAGRHDVATYSIHAEKNFPARKARSTLDVGLPDGTGDAAYMAALAETLPDLIARFAPDLLLYQAGVDPFAGDRLGRLGLSENGLIARDRWIATLAARHGLPLASTLGGGYGEDMMAVARRHVVSVVTLGRAYRAGDDDGKGQEAAAGQGASAGL